MGKEKMRNKEIAEILHITPAAVSMALNNKGGVSESKRKKIFELKYASSQSPEEKEKKKGRILFFIHVKNGNVPRPVPFCPDSGECRPVGPPAGPC